MSEQNTDAGSTQVTSSQALSLISIANGVIKEKGDRSIFIFLAN